uniref:dolichol kinase n=1 Tax=Romanomermis culicivorax TaxID=13658 RepID=A0A915IA52_ROMCU
MLNLSAFQQSNIKREVEKTQFFGLWCTCILPLILLVSRGLSEGWFSNITTSLLLFYLSTVVPAGLVMYFQKCFTFGEFVVLWQAVLFCLQKSLTTLIVLNFWALCVACTAHFAIIVNKTTNLTTVHRKFFHLTVSLVLISGLMYDPQLTYLASIFALHSFLIVELIRYFKVPPFGESLRSSLQLFLDDQDSGSLILTHIYLLVATFAPLWLYPCLNVTDVRFVHFAGLISIGVGDAFASIGGTIFGERRFFHDSGKTIEGTASFFAAEIVISQIIVCFLA